ncbi:prolyl oligopeptidase family serine peptidase [Microvirga lotononidis]|uniref:Serine protease, S9A family peptidase n=1 Tax=Microvirga lotononidis TaxID=864069 RepID=I4YY42_9HYPH|nr:prolyl oligopeptidase family serine peptidase [Microvirga lotononidis]EIM28884.1 serine protease, S9A family peptidase [Microvirga lotononidis]WQO26804.1 prolyl oligopeptidase family serine peptidase [Microvirga lotononidis]
MAEPMQERPDPYLWLEDVEGEEALAWVRAHNDITKAALCDAAFDADKRALYEISTRPDNIPFITRRRGRLYNFWQDADHVRGLWRRTTMDDYLKAEPSWETVLDIDALASAEGEDWVWKGCGTLEPEQRYGLVSLSRGGADAVELREFDLIEKRFIENGFALPEAKGGATWLDRDRLLVSTTLGEEAATASGYPRTIRLWQRGSDFERAPVLFQGEFDDIYISASVDREPGYERVFYRRQITFEEGISYLAQDEGDPLLIDLPRDARFDVEKDWLIVKLKSEWALPERTYPADALLAISFSRFMAGDRRFEMLFEPGPRRVLSGFWWTKSRLVLTVLDNLASQIWLGMPGEPWHLERLQGLPDTASVHAMSLDAGQLERTDEFLLSISSFVEPTKLVLVTEDREIEVLKEAPAAFDASGLEVTRHEAVSVDGESIPYYQIGPKDQQEPRPTVLYGYGGFSVSMTPGYLGGIGKTWLERGNVWVVANIRGGGEFGAAWHKAGMREGKRLSHDDFAAIAQDLVRRGVTTEKQLAAYGGSNGGLLVGNMLTRYPERFGAIWCTVPLLDMRRYTRLLAGPSWVAEYGDPERPEDWAYMAGFSAYQNLEERRPYPPVLLVTSRRDDRVHPGHARKMAARLEALKQPVFFYEPDDGGHGAANKEQAAFLSALGLSFLRKTLGG